jgi:voltage-gated sodium channel
MDMAEAAVGAGRRNGDPLRRIIEPSGFQRALTLLTLVNAVSLGLETSDALMPRASALLIAADRLIVAVFVLEILAKLAVYRRRFVRDPWNVSTSW